ncbi:MAG: AAA-like domain-containing protein, partial [Coleofasciculaceae cyanobacterium]
RWWRDRQNLSALQRLSDFIEEILLREIEQNMVIFIDEIDSVISLNFPVDDFFALLRACYNQRADKPAYQRLTFTLLGVATPSSLIADKSRTPFNIGRAIELGGFQMPAAKPLASGLLNKVNDPEKVLQEILVWTGGQPFLTQKVCKIIRDVEDFPLLSQSNEMTWVSTLVHKYVIDHWEGLDEPEHLKTIRDRLTRNEQSAGRLLSLYKQILLSSQELSRQEEFPASSTSIKSTNFPQPDSQEQAELRLSGLVVKQQGKLRVANRIYEEVFNLSWVELELANFRPYSEGISAWLASDCQDESRLLRGQALHEALAWATTKNLGSLDYQYLSASQTLDKRDVQKALEAQQQANGILATAQKKAKRTIRLGLTGLTLSSVLAVVVIVWAKSALKEAWDGIRLEQSGVSALRQFESEEIESLISALQGGQKLQGMVREEQPLHEYPAISPIWVLQTILDNIHERNQYLGHQGEVWSVSFSPDGQNLATVGKDGKISLWHLSGEQFAQFYSHQQPVLSVSFSPDGQLIATASEDGTAAVWKLSGEQVVQLKGHQGEVWSVSFSPDGQRLATASEDGTAIVWNLLGEQVVQLKGHQGEVWSVSFSPDGQRLATASEDGTAQLWDLAGRQLTKFEGHLGPVLSVSFSTEGKLLATTGLDSTVRLWNWSGEQLVQWKSSRDLVYKVQFSPDGKHLATAGADGTARLWDLSGEELAQLNGHRNSILGMSFSSDGEYLATAGEDGTARLWQLPEQENISRTHVATFAGHQGEVWSVSFSPDGQHLATAGEDGKVRLWNLQGEQLAVLKRHQGGVNNVSFSPDGMLLATAGQDSTVRLWDLSGKQLNVLKGHLGPVYSLSFSPDGKYLATAGKDGTANLWNLSDLGSAQQSSIELKGHEQSVWSVSFSPNGKRLVTAGKDSTVRLWNLSGKQLTVLNTNQDGVLSVDFSPDGKRLITAGTDATVRLWDLSGNRLVEFNNTHQGGILSASFSADGERIVTTGQDGTAQIRLLSGTKIAQFVGHQSRVYSASFSPNGQYLATAGRDGMVRLWRVEGLDELLERGCSWLKDYLATNPHPSKLCSQFPN